TDTTDVSTLDVSNILTETASDLAINKIDEALSDVNTFRGTLGAIQNRFESTVANLQSVSENISAAKSRVMDADFAAETAEMTKAQVLQQAGVAMLAQANMLPQAVLSLLQ
nr:flagellin [Deltaproteobacteria bacterium]